MTFRRLSVFLLLLPAVLAACSPSEPDAQEGNETAVMQSHVIPVDYRGRWGETAAACLTANTRRYEIAATRIDRPDFGGEVEQVTLRDGVAVVQLEAQGAQTAFRMALQDENTMRASYDARGAFTLHRCR
ncbi:hypothetical protein [Aurantiacibacter hainanensis]|uniref:hypothetical protein n=1 Tax=Aurantiacibacter hainanensis TaxID=3076114 RepID=UPI0030C6DCFA